MGFEIKPREHGDILMLALEGTVEPSSAAELRTELLGPVSEGRRSLLLDLSALELISGPGLRVLVMVNERLEAQGGRLALCAPRPDVRRILEIADMADVLPVYASRREALRWLEENVRLARLAHLADALLRKKDPGGAAEKRHVAGVDYDSKRNTAALAAELLGVGR